MIEVFCSNCGKGESDGIVKRYERSAGIHDGIDSMESETIETHFSCKHCGIHEIVEQGALAIKQSQNFHLRESTNSSRLVVRINSDPIKFTEIDEQIATSTHYTTAGARSTSRVHIVHIHAVNPPTLSKGRYNVTIGKHLDEEMFLTDIRYTDSNRRTLKFHRNLSDKVTGQLPEMVKKASP